MNADVKFPDVSSLHETAVQAVARGEVQMPKVRRARRHRESVRKVQVDQDVWREALLIVQQRGFTPRHIQVVNEKQVVVWNHPSPWPSQ